MNREEIDAIYASAFKPEKIKIPKVTAANNSPPVKKLKFDEFEPSQFKDYIGQNKAKEIVQVFADAAKKEERLIPNVLFTGTAGLGKTTLAKLTLKDIPCMFVDGNAVNSNYNQLFGYVIIDEIHNVKADVCDSLNVLMDNSIINVLGCTTNPGKLPKALRSRFRTVTLFPYSDADLVEIMKGVLKRKKKFSVNESLLEEVAVRSRSTPRRALQYLSFILDVMLVRNQTKLIPQTLFDSFAMLGVDDYGLLEIDHKYLAAFPEDGRSVGLQYLSAVLATDVETIQEEIEPYLMQLKLIDRTAKGRKRLS